MTTSLHSLPEVAKNGQGCYFLPIHNKMLVYWFAYITSFTLIVGKHESPHTANVNEIQMGNAGRYIRGPKKKKVGRH